MAINMQETLIQLCSEPGISSCTGKLAQRCAAMLSPFVERVETDSWGNVRGYRFSQKPDAPTLMLDAHIDQVGFFVTGVDEEGFLSLKGIGLDLRLLLGLPVLIATGSGMIAAVVVPRDGNFSVNKATNELELVADTGLSPKEVKGFIAPGDQVVYANEAILMSHGRLCSKAVDDRSGFAALLRTAEKLQGHALPCNIVFSGSDREELGGPSASVSAEKVKPDLFFAVDVCHASSRFAAEGEFLGKGPCIAHGATVELRWSEHLEHLAKTLSLPVQRFTYGYVSGTNAGEVQITGKGYRCAVMSLPIRYMHTPGEIVTLQDIETMSDLLYHFALTYEG